jgi:hypothetical protein
MNVAVPRIKRWEALAVKHSPSPCAPGYKYLSLFLTVHEHRPPVRHCRRRRELKLPLAPVADQPFQPLH